MADAGNTDTAGDKGSKGDVTINNNFAGATINNLGNLLQDSASQTTNLCQPPSPATPSAIDSTATESAGDPPPAPASRKSATFIIEGSIKDLTPTELARLQAFVESLRKRTGDASLTVTEFSEGSIRLTLEGSEDSITKLQELFDAGKMATILNRPVRSAEFIEVDASAQSYIVNDPVKALLVACLRAIAPDSSIVMNLGEADLAFAKLRKASLRKANLVRAKLVGADLFKADLFRADLREADLFKADLFRADLRDTALRDTNFSEADLRVANLERADLSHADLRSANCRNADFRAANLSGANLSGADLREAQLLGVDLREANVENTVFSGSRGLTELAKADLKFRGAIFEDSPGDRSEVSTPAPVPR